MYNFPQFPYNPLISRAILHNFVQLYINARRDLVPNVLLRCITVLLICSSMFSLIMATYSGNM